MISKLLISVRDQREATTVESLPADLRSLIGVIDLKEPANGSLGRASNETAQWFLQSVSSESTCSVALGELAEAREITSGCRTSSNISPHVPTGFAYAKLGLAKASRIANWQDEWKKQINQLPAGTQPVAVIYLDHVHCQAPAPNDVLEAALRLGCRGVLLDTFNKNAGDFRQHLPASRLGQLLETIHQNQIFSVLAGSVDLNTLPAAMEFRPSLVGIRGAVCESDRSGSISTSKLNGFCQRLSDLHHTIPESKSTKPRRNWLG